MRIIKGEYYIVHEKYRKEYSKFVEQSSVIKILDIDDVLNYVYVHWAYSKDEIWIPRKCIKRKLDLQKERDQKICEAGHI
ncbi:MAG: hypothetical protein JSW60_08715 [Thermoplasmatales archaeon]|nr:MAG: hypothetical protein JSW60_08715 [Thermoplasmatales archaeon]